MDICNFRPFLPFFGRLLSQQIDLQSERLCTKVFDLWALGFDFPQIIHSTVYVLELWFWKKGKKSFFFIFLDMIFTTILRKIVGARDKPQGLLMEYVENKLTSQCWQSPGQWKLTIPYCFHGKSTFFLTKEVVMIYIMMSECLSTCVSQKITTFSSCIKVRFEMCSKMFEKLFHK